MSTTEERKIDFGIVERMGGKVQKVAAGQPIVQAGEPATRMFILRKGTVSVQADGLEIDHIAEGEIFGEMAMIDHSPRSATIIAKTDCEIVSVDERLFLLLIRQTPYFALDVMRTLVHRLRAMNERVGG